MTNWDIYEKGLISIGAMYLFDLVLAPDPIMLDLYMILFFGWLLGVGSIVFIIEGGNK